MTVIEKKSYAQASFRCDCPGEISQKEEKIFSSRSLDHFNANQTARALKDATCNNGERESPLHLYLDLHPQNVLIEDEKSLQVRIVDFSPVPRDEKELIEEIGRLFYYLLTSEDKILEGG